MDFFDQDVDKEGTFVAFVPWLKPRTASNHLFDAHLRNITSVCTKMCTSPISNTKHDEISICKHCFDLDSVNARV